MKKRIYIITCLSACLFPVYAQESISIKLSFSMNNFHIESGQGKTQWIAADDINYFYASESNVPEFPLRTIMVLVPNGAEFQGCSYAITTQPVAENFIPVKAKGPVADMMWESQTQEKAYHDDFPDEIVKYTSTQVARGYTWLSFIVSPFIYRSEGGELSLVVDLSLNISYRIQNSGKTEIHPEASLMAFLQSNMINPGDIEHFYSGTKSGELKSAQDPIDYLVITSDELKPEFLPLVDWKFRKGLKTDIITISEIIDMYNDTSIQVRIKRCIKKYYEDNDLKWVLLGGDHTVVPVQGCYAKVPALNFTVVDTLIPADLFYACLENRLDWNEYVDNMIGNLNLDKPDRTPEVYLTRIPVSTKEQARNIVKKILTYEQNPPLYGFADRMLLAGVKTFTSWDHKSDSHFKSNLIYEQYISSEWSGECLIFFDTGTDFPGGDSCDVTASNLTEIIERGFGLIHYAGHGNFNSLKMEKGAAFNHLNAASLQNPVSGILLANTCRINYYDTKETCLGEAFLHNPTGGFVALFGSSRYGFVSSIDSLILGPSLSYNAQFMKYLLDENPGLKWHSFGTVASLAKQQYCFSLSERSAHPYLQYAICPLGDPEMPVYTRALKTFENAYYREKENALEVYTGDVEGCRICLTSLKDGDTFQEVVEELSSYTFENIPEEFQLTITAPNFIPRIFTSRKVFLDQDKLHLLRIYPNPVADLLQIEFDLPLADMLLYDAQGRLIMQSKLEYGLNSIPMHHYSPGLYILKIISDKGVFSKSLVVDR